MNDAELIALAAISQNEAVLMAGDNEARRINGYAPAWTDGCGFLPATTKLYDELRARSIL